ncbi:MAG: trehalose-phosphatase [Chloroflexota bacterium]|nr:trehalose-phosphatase [Chloroflexota bacterium]
MTSDGAELHIQLARDVLFMAPAGFVTDLDGTLSQIVDEPAAARPIADVPELLRVLAHRLAVVAVVTGRSAADARRILGPVGRQLLIVGNHGLEWLAPGAEEPQAPVHAEGLRAAVRAAMAAVSPADGVVIDDKGLSATVHYRAAPDPIAARRMLLAAFRILPPGIELREGRRSVELRPAGIGDKGSAVARIAEEHALRGLLVAGDDVTDIDMFHAADALRAQGVSTLTLAVAGGVEVSRAVSDAADVTVPSPEALVRILQGVTASLPG